MIEKDAKGQRTWCSFGYYSLYIYLGLAAALLGPTLPALAAQTHTVIGRMGWVFMAGSLGMTLGTALGGRVYDRAPGHPVLGAAQLVSAVLIFLAPSIPWFWPLLLLLACKGVADGLINMGTNTLIVWVHGEKSGPYMNALHFCFGVGAFVAPLVVAQVIAVPGGYRWAYRAVALIALLISVRTFTLPPSPRPADHGDATKKEAARARVYYPLVAAATLYIFFYVGAELGFAGWLYTYAVTLRLTTAAQAAYLTSGFWLSFTLGRLVSIPLATRFRPQRIILLNVTACLLLLALLISLPGSRLVLPAAVLGLGFCLAPLWPTGYTLAGQSLDLSAAVSGIILLGDSLGAMLLPWLAGGIIQAHGPRAMVYLVTGSLSCNAAAFIAMLRLRGRAARKATSQA